jgi:hypothetical protein
MFSRYVGCEHIIGEYKKLCINDQLLYGDSNHLQKVFYILSLMIRLYMVQYE